MVRKLSLMKMLLVLITILIWSHFVFYTSGDAGILHDNTPFNIAFLFSGESMENLTACSWIFENITSEEVRGPNEAFREYFSDDLSNEIATYPQIDRVHQIKYTNTYNYFTGLAQYDPDHRWYPQEGVNVSKFDPYYCFVRLFFDLNKTWTVQLANNIEEMLLNKWYVEQVMIIPDVRVPQSTPFGSDHFYQTMILLLAGIALFRRKNKKSNYSFTNSSRLFLRKN
jgi:hypothetical protein